MQKRVRNVYVYITTELPFCIPLLVVGEEVEAGGGGGGSIDRKVFVEKGDIFSYL